MRKGLLLILAAALAGLVLVLVDRTGAGARNAPPAVQPLGAPTAVPAQPSEAGLQQVADPVQAAASSPTDPVDPGAGEALDEPTTAAVPSVSGRVTSAFGEPIGGVDVEVRLGFDGEGTALGVSTTDSDGWYRAELGRPQELSKHSREAKRSRAWARRRLVYDKKLPPDSPYSPKAGSPKAGVEAEPRLCAVVALPGYQTAVECTEQIDGEIVLNLTLQAGAMLVGEVLDPTGAFRVPGCEVVLLDAADRIAARSTTRFDGRWSLGLADGGKHRVFARKRGLGTAVKAIDFSAHMAHQAGVLQLRGPGILRGRVTYPGGARVAQLAMTAVHEEIALAGPAPSEVQRIDFEGGRGLAEQRWETDASGGFEVAGFQPGRYRLTYPGVSAELQPTLLVPTGSEVLELVFAGRRLEVSVGVKRREQLQGVVLECVVLRETTRGTVERGARRTHTLTSEESKCWVVEAGREYMVSATGTNGASDTKIVRIPPAPFETGVQLYLAEDDSNNADLPVRVRRETWRKGSLRLRLVAPKDADGAAPELEECLVTVTHADAAGDEPVLRDAVPEEGGSLGKLAVGLYRVRVAPRAVEGVYWRPSREVTDAVVREGEETVLEVPLEVGGRVELVLDASLRPPGRRTIEAAGEGRALVDAVRAFVRLEGESLELERALRFGEASPARASDGERLQVGASAICDPVLAPGRYRLRLEGAALDDREIEFEIQRGVTSRLVLREN